MQIEETGILRGVKEGRIILILTPHDEWTEEDALKFIKLMSGDGL